MPVVFMRKLPVFSLSILTTISSATALAATNLPYSAYQTKSDTGGLLQEAPIMSFLKRSNYEPLSHVSKSLSYAERIEKQRQHRQRDLLLNKAPPALIEDEVVKKINKARVECGFGEVVRNENLSGAALNHTKYMRYITERAPFLVFNAHNEQRIRGVANSGSTNPYYKGRTPSARIKKSGYRYAVPKYGAEALAKLTNVPPITREVQLSDDKAYYDIFGKLMIAPYHTRGLLNPAIKDVGAHYGLYTSYDGGYAGYTAQHFLVINAGEGQGEKRKASKTLTYPCNSTLDAYHILDSEVPDPMKGVGRNLQKEPVGHPVYLLTTGNTRAKVKNVSYINLKTKEVLETHILDKSNDPNRLLNSNELFIIPLKPLDSDTFYKVSFDLSQGHDFVHKDITFKTAL